MNFPSILILALVLLWLFFALRHVVKNKGCVCCGTVGKKKNKAACHCCDGCGKCH